MTIRFEYLKENSDPWCDNCFFPQESITNNVEKLSQMIGVNSSEEINQNFSKGDINDAAEMFLALISCPLSFFEELYLKAVTGPKSKIALLTSNIIKKTKSNEKIDALKIFAKISSVLGFSYQLTEKERDLEYTRNIFDVKGEI